MRTGGGSAGLLAAALLAALLLPAPASAANRRVSIGNYTWSQETIHVDLGEHVSWYWIGPDTMHSVTGTSPLSAGLDSDPRTNQPKHRIGDSFRLDFDKPGVYSFQCKLHSTVRGTVVVSDTPGDPDTEPDPVPKSRVDLKPPNVRDLRLDRTAFRRHGTPLRYSTNERARIEVEYFRLRRHGRRRFAGYARYPGGHVGFNSLRFGIRRKHFRARPGRYLARVTAIDRSANRTRPFRLRFRILSGHRRR